MTSDNAHQNAPTKPLQFYDPEKDLFQSTSLCGLSYKMSVALNSWKPPWPLMW